LLETTYLEALALLPEEVAPSPEAQLMAVESLQQIDRVLDGLPPKVREAFLLAHLIELSYAEIAERLGTSTSSVKQYLTRANRECMFALAV
jgi:RNA polymerase sigma-70 factor (ECF subfamily)